MTDKLHPSDLDDLREVMETGDKLIRLSHLREVLAEVIPEMVSETYRLNGIIARAACVDFDPVRGAEGLVEDMLAILGEANRCP